ncbi:MAG: peptidylprolyl isomerase [Pirellulaceae bacterium]
MFEFRHLPRLLALVFAMGFLFVQLGRAQEEAFNFDDSRKQLDNLVEQWREIMIKANQGKTDFYSGERVDNLENKKTYEDAVAAGKKMQVEVRNLVLKLFVSTDKPDKDLEELALFAIEDLARNALFTRLLPVVEHGLKIEPDNSFYLLNLGIAAMGSGRLDLAEKFSQEHPSYIDEMGEVYRTAYQKQLLTLKKNQDAEKALNEKAKDLPVVKITTSKGVITAELFEDEAPGTVANFVSLVEKGYYDGLIFHRVLANFMAQTGCPSGTGFGGPGYTIYDEHENGRHHFAYVLSMANGGKLNSGGSQFFIAKWPLSYLDGKHTVFGRVIDGFDVVDSIQLTHREDPENPEGETPLPGVSPDKMIKLEMVKKRDHEYKPSKVGE